MWSGIFVLGLIGIVLSMGFMLVERRILNWYLGLKESKHA
jgi:ABC-type nitrate/sulfonate/bicarbonate transport system permease component